MLSKLNVNSMLFKCVKSKDKNKIIIYVTGQCNQNQSVFS